jgi:hypothetical protein
LGAVACAALRRGDMGQRTKDLKPTVRTTRITDKGSEPALPSQNSARFYFTRNWVWLSIFFCLQFYGWWTLIPYNHQRAVAARSEAKAPVLGSDINKYNTYFQYYPETASWASKPGVFHQFVKRPLYPPIFISTNWILSKAGISYPSRMYLFLAFFAALSGALVCLLLIKMNWSPLQAVLGALFCTSSFSWLSTFSIPESYSLTISAAILSLLSGHRFVQMQPSSHLRRYQHAVISGVAAWLYLPLCGASLLVLSSLNDRRQWLTTAFPVVLIAAAIAIAPQLLSEFGGLQKQMTYGARYSSVGNLASYELWRDVTTVFFFFSFIAPVGDFLTSSGRPDWSYVSSSLPTIMAIIIMATGYYLLIARVIAGRLGRELLGVATWSLALLLFGIVFNPKEALLYASLPATLAAYIVGLVLGHDRGWQIASPARRTVSVMALTIGVVLLVCLNASSIFGW